MHPSKVTLRPKVRRPMAWNSTKQRAQASHRRNAPRAETRPHRGRYSAIRRTDTHIRLTVRQPNSWIDLHAGWLVQDGLDLVREKEIHRHARSTRPSVRRTSVGVGAALQ